MVRTLIASTIIILFSEMLEFFQNILFKEKIKFVYIHTNNTSFLSMKKERQGQHAELFEF
jgi:hypothetical protein